MFSRLVSRAEDVPAPVREHQFHASRRWRFDFAWPDQQVAVEIEGGTFSRRQGRHNSGIGHHRDCEKYNAAALLGWCVLRYTTKDLQERPLQIVEEVRRAISKRSLTNGDGNAD